MLAETVPKCPSETIPATPAARPARAYTRSLIQLTRNPLKRALRYDFDLAEYDELHTDLRTSTVRRRMRMKGLVRMRVDSIVLASLCTQCVICKFRLKEMVLSTHALKEGALEEA